MLHELRYINTSTINGTMAVNEDNYNDDDDKQDEQRGRNKIPHWMMISISCHFIQSIQFICLLANLFEQTMRSRFFYHSWLCAVCSTPISYTSSSSSSTSLYTFYTRTLDNVSLFAWFFPATIQRVVKIVSCLNRNMRGALFCWLLGGPFNKRGYELLVKWWIDIVFMCGACFMLLHSSVVVLHLLRSFRGFEAHCVNVSVCLHALIFLISHQHSWENLMCYWMIFIQIYCIENINSADYDWLMIMFDCVFVWLFVCSFVCANVPVHLWLRTQMCTCTHFYAPFSRSCTVCTHIYHN